MTSQPNLPEAELLTAIDAWRARVAHDRMAPAVRYFDQTISVAGLDEMSDALASWLQDRAVGLGDRVGVQMQNIPAFVMALLAVWKAGGSVVLLNPMYHGRELRELLENSAPVGVICGDDLTSHVQTASTDSSVSWIVSASAGDYQSRFDRRVFANFHRHAPAVDGDLRELIARNSGRVPRHVELGPNDIALFSYTSGTTGPPKGATNTHGNVMAVATTFALWSNVESGDVVFALAPLFHITGAVINAVLGLVHDTTLVLAGRFNPEVTLTAFAENRVTYTICSITVFNSLMTVNDRSAQWLSSAKFLYSGGAPIAPATVERFEHEYGLYVHNAYGLTETTSGVVAVPAGHRAPIDLASGTLSIGKALPGVSIQIVRPNGDPVDLGEEGELTISGPQVIPGLLE